MKDYLGFEVPRAEIESKEPGNHPTCWITLHYPVSDTKFVARAEAAFATAGGGWRPDTEVRPVPPIDGVAEAVFVSHGTGLFRGWTESEFKSKTKAAKKALAALKLPTYRKRLTLADML